MQEDSNDKEEQYKQIMKEIRQYYENDSSHNDGEGDGEKYKELLIALDASDAPAFVIKAIAEIYYNVFTFADFFEES